MIEYGLSHQEAEEKLARYGLNQLPEAPPPSNFKLVLNQLKSPLVYILLAAGIVTIILREYTDSLVISIAVFINTALGFVQEKRAGQALSALKKLLTPEAQVIREGKVINVLVKNLVPGDTVILSKGDKVPADGQLIFANRMFFNEAALTGESVSVSKASSERVYMGTIVAAGQGKMVVEETGASTEIGKLATSISELHTETPLGKQLKKFSKQLTYLVLILTVLIFVLGILFGRTPLEVFETSVALSVAAIPEGLLIGLTVVLAIGTQRVLHHKGLVRNLVSAETLGGVTTICVDKTGTLTQGKMQVVEVLGDANEIQFQCIVANDLDDPIIISAYEWAVKDKDFDENNYERYDSIPFTSENKFFASLNKFNAENNALFVNGAPEILLSRTTMAEKHKEEVSSQIQELTLKGRRVLGFCRKLVSVDQRELALEDFEHELTWLGMLAFDDPVRKDVKSSLEKTKHAGIRLIVITGDYAQTAVSILNEIGIQVKPEDIILGSDLEQLSEQELDERLFNSTDVKLFARTKPDQKLKIVLALKNQGEVVAMMGDGVNDAPALTSADIGIVVGEATDVAKESADLVLLDSSFKTIILAIEEGRAIFNNLRKMVLYLMSDAFVGIFVVIVSLLLDLPLPITAAQILWVNLISDGFPNLALTIDPKAKDIMKHKPRSPKEPLLTNWLKQLIFLVSFFSALIVFGIFLYLLKSTNDLQLARSVVFATVGVNSLVYVFSIKGLTSPFWKINMLDNKWLLLAVAGGFILQFSPFVFAPLTHMLGLVSIGLYWGWALSAALLVFILIELTKYVLRARFVD